LQLTFAIREDRVCITRNITDFKALHELIMESGGSHPGIFAVYSDNNQRRDLKSNHIVKAIGNITAILSSTRNHFLRLNEWR
jgi:hypothetical protein